MLTATFVAMLATFIMVPSCLIGLAGRGTSFSNRAAIYSGAVVVAYLYVLTSIVR